MKRFEEYITRLTPRHLKEVPGSIFKYTRNACLIYNCENLGELLICNSRI